MKILTIKQPYASALLLGIYDGERRKFKLSGPTIIHAAKDAAMSPTKIGAFFAANGDGVAASALCWGEGKGEFPAEQSLMSMLIGDSCDALGTLLPVGRIVGFVEDWDCVKEGPIWVNKPIGSTHFIPGLETPEHRGVLGFVNAPEHMEKFILGLLNTTKE